MEIRSARDGDRSAWEQMRQALWPSPPGEHAREIDRYFSADRRNPAEAFLAFDDRGEAVGLIELSIRSDAEGCVTDRVAYVEGWYVASPARRAGVGRALVAAGERWARASGCSELGSDTEVDNATSAAAHLALGFLETGTIRCFRKAL